MSYGQGFHCERSAAIWMGGGDVAGMDYRVVSLLAMTAWGAVTTNKGICSPLRAYALGERYRASANQRPHQPHLLGEGGDYLLVFILSCRHAKMGLLFSGRILSI
jgi:hypothetical protein